MNCNEFWKSYEESGLTHELQKHLNECKNCQNEMLIELRIEKTIKNIGQYRAPERAWDSIQNALEKNHVKERVTRSLPEKIRDFLRDRIRFPEKISLKPVGQREAGNMNW